VRATPQVSPSPASLIANPRHEKAMADTSVEPGTTIYMPAFAKVSVQNGEEPLVALQVFSGPSPARKYDAWTDLGARQ